MIKVISEKDIKSLANKYYEAEFPDLPHSLDDVEEATRASDVIRWLLYTGRVTPYKGWRSPSL